jgi:hypothetical protein
MANGTPLTNKGPWTTVNEYLVWYETSTGDADDAAAVLLGYVKDRVAALCAGLVELQPNVDYPDEHYSMATLAKIIARAETPLPRRFPEYSNPEYVRFRRFRPIYEALVQAARFVHGLEAAMCAAHQTTRYMYAQLVDPKSCVVCHDHFARLIKEGPQLFMVHPVAWLPPIQRLFDLFGPVPQDDPAQIKMTYCNDCHKTMAAGSLCSVMKFYHFNHIWD